MSELVTLELPEELTRRARAVAAQTRRSFEDVLVDWMQQAGTEPPVESLADEEILALCDGQMEPSQQEELDILLERNREGQLQDTDRGRLEGLLRAYRLGLVRKAQAWKTAVARGLRPPLS